MQDGMTYSANYTDQSEFIYDRLWEYIHFMEKPTVVNFSVETATPFDQAVTLSEEHVVEASILDEMGFLSGLWSISRTGGKKTYIAFRFMKHSSRAWIRIASEDAEHVDRLKVEIARQLPPVEQKTDRFRCKFWHWAGSNASYNIRQLEGPTWDEIKENYAPKTREELQAFVDIKPENITGGRLAILHGPPGTGKTTMIRALCREWKDWCSIDYIVDPEQFFGNAMYMDNCLTTPPEPIYGSNPQSIWDEDDEDEAFLARIFNELPEVEATDAPWRLIIIEDAEEFLNPDAKSHTGQALSRLLNVGDGFIGQGLNLMILLTTNTPLKDVHEAVKRPGRCMVNIEVPALDPDEATKWLGTSSSKATLAELFEAKKETQIGTGVSQFKGKTGAYL